MDFQLRYHQGLYQRLRDEGWDVHLVSSGGALLDQLACDGFTTHQLAMKRRPSFRDLQALQHMSSLIRKLNPAVVIAGSPKASMLAIRSAQRVGVPIRMYVVWGVRSEVGSGLGVRIARAAELATTRSATHVVAVSESVRSALIANGLVREGMSVDVIGSGSTAGVDLDRFVPTKNPAPLTRIGFVGRVTRDKGIRELAGAMELLVREGRKLELVLAGPVEDAEGAEAIARIRRAGLASVTVLPYVLDPRPVLASVGLICLPSYREGLPNVILEAFAMKVPVVASNVTGITDLVRDGRTGRVVAPYSAQSLARGIASAIDDPAETRRMAQAAREFAAEAFASGPVLDAWTEYVNRAR